MQSPVSNPHAEPGTALDASAAWFKALLDQSAASLMSAPAQALTLADRALSGLPALPSQAAPGGVETSPRHALALRAHGLALHYGGRHAEGMLD